MKYLSILLVLLFTYQKSFSQQYISISSPNKEIKVDVALSTKIYYSVKYKDEEIVSHSTLSLTLNNGKILGNNPVLTSTKEISVSNVLKPVWGKSAFIDNTFNEVVLNCQGNYSVTFRVYNDGMAYRFGTSIKDKITIVDEEVKYRFNNNLSFYYPEKENYESTFALKDFYSIEKTNVIYLPLVMQPKENIKSYRVLLSEADVIDYPSLLLKKSDDWLTHLDGTFKKYPTQFKQGGYLDYTPIATAEANFIAQTNGTRTFPWRAMAIVPNDKALISQDLIYKLAQESKSKNWDWVKPGLCTWEYWSNLNLEGVDFKLGQNKKTYEYYINFASANKIPYVVIDWKWSLEHDLKVLNPDMDVPHLMKFAKEKNVKVVLWVLAHTLYKGLENNVDYLKSLGASGVKIDFFDREDQLSNQMYEKIADACAKRQLVVDFHGCAKPSGLHKAYPNILNYEAVFGNEYNIFGNGVPINHHLNIPFIRGAIGPMDFTPGGFRNTIERDFTVSTSEPKVQGTRAHQMAMFVVYEAGLQMMCDAPTEYMKSKDLLDLLVNTPATWDETVPLHGKIGEHVVIARRSGTSWYIGAMTDWTAREIDLDLSFLGEGNYKATIVSDGINADKIAKDYKITVDPLDKSKPFKLNLAKGGGAYIKLEKQ